MTAAFERDGFDVFQALLSETEVASVETALTDRGGVGARDLLDEPWCLALARRLQTDARLVDALPSTHVPVQCTSFEKSVERNWLVGLHQDLAIPVASLLTHPALTRWSNKGGTWFVQPPVEVLKALVALRVHIDDCGEHDGPLKVVTGSHRQGLLSDIEATALRSERGVVGCPVPRGGAMLMRPLLLHASSKATGASRRRVLHFLFGPPRLPFGLAWACGRAQPGAHRPRFT